MKRKQKCIFAVGMTMAMAILTACSNEQASVSDTYKANTESSENDTERNHEDSEYEISDMLPELSDDTLIMTVEEAEKFMNDRANMYNQRVEE